MEKNSLKMLSRSVQHFSTVWMWLPGEKLHSKVWKLVSGSEFSGLCCRLGSRGFWRSGWMCSGREERCHLQSPLTVPMSFSSRYRLNPALLNSREQVSSQFAVTLMQTLSGAVNMLYMLIQVYLCVCSSSWQLHGFQVSKRVVMLGEWDKTALSLVACIKYQSLIFSWMRYTGLLQNGSTNQIRCHLKSLESTHKYITGFA